MPPATLTGCKKHEGVWIGTARKNFSRAQRARKAYKHSRVFRDVWWFLRAGSDVEYMRNHHGMTCDLVMKCYHVMTYENHGM